MKTMKNILIYSGLIIYLILNTHFSFAQCVPDTNVIDTSGLGIKKPDTIFATELQMMNTTLTMICPVINIIPGDTISIHHYTINYLMWQPGWMSYICNPVTCEYMAGVRKCVRITGTPPSGSAGTYYLRFMADGYTEVLGTPVLLANMLCFGDTLTLIVQTSSAVTDNNIPDLIIKQNNPNPFIKKTNIRYFTKAPVSVNLTVVNLMGTVVYSEQMIAHTGENIFDFTGEELNSGVYFYSISNENRRITIKKMVKIN
jgi:hypothetical protein